VFRDDLHGLESIKIACTVLHNHSRSAKRSARLQVERTVFRAALIRANVNSWGFMND
jgi:hypothetical protein